MRPVKNKKRIDPQSTINLDSLIQPLITDDEAKKITEFNHE